jgi:putative SOS response-associated peptidase YedK
MINARCETLATSNAFKNAYKRRRCLIPADGFYEWKLNADGKTKQPMYVHMKDGRPFALAGLWESWQDDKGNEMRSATIITTTPNKLMAQMHNRMPVMIAPKDFERWLAKGDISPEQLNDLLVPYPDGEMEAYPVSKNVNSARNEGADLVKRVEEEKTTLFG